MKPEASLPSPQAQRGHAARLLSHPLAGLALALLVGLALRLWLWGQIPRTGWISDEGEYFSAASWLAQGRGFAWYQHYLWTRAPLYPLFLAAHLRLFGSALAPIYVSQNALSLLNCALAFALTRRLLQFAAGPRRGASRPERAPSAGQATPAQPPQADRPPRVVPTIAALLMAFSFPLAIYPQALLSETLFITLLLSGFLALACGSQAALGRAFLARQYGWLLVAGGLFGLATLTRSLTLLFLPVVAIWLFAATPRSKGQPPSDYKGFWLPGLGSRFAAPIAFMLAAALTIAPWTLYNSRLYGGLVLVDTSGAFNLMLGGRTAYDGNNRLDAPTRNLVRALVDQYLTREQRARLLAPIAAADGTVLSDGPCLARAGDPAFAAAIGRPDATSLPQAQVQQLMTAEGLCLIRARPAAFAAKSLGELVDLFQINYSGDERFTDNFTTGRLPRWYALGLFVLDDTLYVLTLPLAVLGWALLWQEQRKRQTTNARQPQSTLLLLIGMWLLYNLAVAPLLFAINRFRLPLLPFAWMLAAYALAALPAGWRALTRRAQLGWGGLALALTLLAATPYAYLLPLNERGASPWASYLGPFPSSLDDTLRALAARPAYLRSERLRAALQRGDLALARELLASGPLTPDAQRLAPALIAGLAGQPADGLAKLEPAAIAAARDVKGAIVRADLLRSSGDLAGARRLFSEQFIDNTNPVAFAWDWLRPAPTRAIDIAGNLDLGYISGCYLGEGDPQAQGNFRWCGDGAHLRFPQGGTGAAQVLRLRADGRGWAGYAAAPPPVQVYLGEQLVGSFTPGADAPGEHALTLPASAPGADLEITLRTPTFVPEAARYLSQQGAQAGQLQQLGVRLDWARLEAAP